MGDKVDAKNYQSGKEGCEDGLVIKRLGNMMYLIKGQRSEHKRHLNQLNMWHIEERRIILTGVTSI